jgi:DNA polymerase I-like protein with 3'-5' exonuclease and polymerase domains
MLQYEWTHVGTSSQAYRIYSGTPARKVLVILDRPEHTQGDFSKCIGPEALDTYKRVVNHAVETEGLEDFEITLAAIDRPSQDRPMSAQALFLMKNYSPDAVVFGSIRLAEVFLEDDWRKNFGRLQKKKLSSTLPNGKIFRQKRRVITTVPVSGWTDPDPPVKGDKGGGMVTLIGLVLADLHTAITGKNRYDISPEVDLSYTTVDTMAKFKKFYAKLISSEIVAIDTEGSNLTNLSNTLLSIQFTLNNNDGTGYSSYFLPMRHRETPWTPEEYDKIKKRLRKYFEFGKSKYHIYHNVKYDAKQTYSELGVRFYAHKVYDTIAGEFSLNENRKFLSGIGFNSKLDCGPYSLQTLEWRYGYVRKGLPIGKEDRSNMANQKLADIAKYGVADTVTILLIHRCQLREARRRGYKGYLRIVADQIRNMAIVMSRLEYNGSCVDAAYLQELMFPSSIVNKTISDAALKFKKSKSARKLNSRMLKESGYEQQGLFGKTEKEWVLNIGKPEHLRRLFIETLKLKPLSYGKSGEPSLGKEFKEAYKAVPEVGWFTDYNKMRKIKEAFVDDFHYRLLNDPDALVDGRIRSNYAYSSIVTGRSCSYDFNNQQVPSRGKLAKIVKRIFVAPKNKILIKSDFSAHEIRGFGNVTGDPKMMAAFKTAENAINFLRTCPPEKVQEALERMKQDGDIHIQNAYHFYGKWITKEDPLRQAIKTVVFGVAYGMSAIALSKNLKTTKEEAQALIDKLFETWEVAGSWMNELRMMAARLLYIVSPIGRVRHLEAYLHTSPKVHGAMDRRAVNSDIQGYSSDVGYTAMEKIWETYWHTCLSKGLDYGFLQVNSVHDSSTSETLIETAPVIMYLVEHGMTTFVMDHYREAYKVETPIPYGFDMEIGFNEAELVKWDEYRFDQLHKKGEELLKARDVPKRVAKCFHHNVDAIAEVRMTELKSDPYVCTLKGKTKWFEQNIRLAA